MSEFIGYIVQILKDPALREKLSQQTLQGVEKFSWPSAVEKYTEYYTRAIQRNAERKQLS
jgi:glycosyltransferase involved in cell wall biosynthesis